MNINEKLIIVKNSCDKESSKYYRTANAILTFTFLGVLILAIGIFQTFFYNKSKFVDNKLFYVCVAVLITFFGVFISLYRMHIKESFKYYHLSIGFMRMEIAIDIAKDDENQKSDLIKALTSSAFTVETNNFLSNKKKVESPLPGHFGLDGVIFLLNRIMGILEKIEKPK